MAHHDGSDNSFVWIDSGSGRGPSQFSPLGCVVGLVFFFMIVGVVYVIDLHVSDLDKGVRNQHSTANAHAYMADHFSKDMTYELICEPETDKTNSQHCEATWVEADGRTAILGIDCSINQNGSCFICAGLNQ